MGGEPLWSAVEGREKMEARKTMDVNMMSAENPPTEKNADPKHRKHFSINSIFGLRF